VSRKRSTPSDAVIKTLKPKSVNQADYLRSICENIITIGEGCSGNGKTMLGIYMACNHLLEGKINNIMVSRSIIGCGKDLGALPGSVDERTEIYFRPHIEYFEYFLGREKSKELMRTGIISLLPIEILRGNTFVDTTMILDEAQNCSIQQLRLFLSRIGHGSNIIMMGDSDQSDTSYNAFKYCVDHLSELDNVGVIKFGYQDIQRHPIIGPVLEKLKNVGN